MDHCTFCKILSGKLPASIVAQDEAIIAFLDIHPVSPGHTLVIPRRHVESFTDLSATEGEQLLVTAQAIAIRMKQALPGCEGVTLSLADGESAGQEVPHSHLHVIPRRTGDGFGWRVPPNYQEEATAREILDEMAETIRL